MTFDYIIVGHGLAGATLAWQLHWLGQSVAVCDAETPQTASRIATGLISPITGQRHTLSSRYDDFWETAWQFYRRVETETGCRCLLEPTVAKVVDEATLERLRNSDELARYLGQTIHLDTPFRPAKAVRLQQSARLDFKAYLKASREHLAREDRYFGQDVNIAQHRQAESQSILILPLGLKGRRVVFCQGVQAMQNPVFGPLPFQPAKGEILELRTPEFRNQPTLLGDVWIAPVAEDRCEVGATFERDPADVKPTDRAKAELLEKLTALSDASGEVVAHHAAVRPVMQGRMPQFYFDYRRQVGFFNGLGSKGGLRAPMAAKQFARLLVCQELVDDAFWYNAMPSTSRTTRLTTQAQRIVAEVVQRGDTVVDATAGNGMIRSS